MAQESGGEVAVLRERLRRAENDAVERGAILQWIEDVLEGREVCEFAESFEIVRRVRALTYLARMATGEERS